MTSMAKSDEPIRPTDGELALLKVLWRRGPSTVREVHEDLRAAQETAYTTTLKLLQIMTEKGIVERDESQKSHVYRAVAGEEQVKKSFVRDMMEKVFAGSASQLVMSALGSKPATAGEIDEIRRMLDDLAKKRRR
jgi:BlaI family transcriptional regulator, penicillinase repressor